jgi:hypothetical protein
VAKFLQDKDPETRHHAQDLMKFLMTEYEDFESVFHTQLDEETWTKIVKQITSMRRELKRVSNDSSSD